MNNMNNELPVGLLSTPSTPAKCPTCPKCKQNENTVEVCRTCGYEYPEDDDSTWYDIARFVIISAIIIWFLTTVLAWVMNNSVGDHCTLVEMFVGQFNFIKGLRFW